MSDLAPAALAAILHGILIAGMLLLGAGIFWLGCYRFLKPFTPPLSNRRDCSPADGCRTPEFPNHQRVHMALHGSPIMLAAQDRDLRYTWVDHPVAGWIGIEMLGKRDTDLLEQRDEAEALEGFKREVLQTGRGLRRVAHLHFSGTEQVYDITISPLREEGREVSGLTCAVVDITMERMRAKENEARYRLLFEHAVEIMCIHEVVRDAEGNIVDWVHQDVNSAYAEVYRIPRERAIGSRASELHRGALEVFRETVTDVMAKGEVKRSETYVKALDKFFDMSIFPLGDRFFASVGVDITEHKRSEEQVRIAGEEVEKSLLELQAVIGNMTESVVIFDGSGTVLTANQAAVKLSGYASEEEFKRLACGRADVAEMYEVSDLQGRPLPQTEWPLAIALRGETCSGMEIRVRRKDSGDTWVGRYSAAPVRNEKGEAVRVILTGHDITEQRRAEQALRASELRLRRLAESGILGVYYGDESGGIFDANDAFLLMMGYTREDLGAGRLNWRHSTPAEYLPHDEKMMVEAKACGACTPYEKEFIRKNGTRVPVSLGFALLEGSQSDYICFVLDRTAQKRLEEELRTRNEQLAAADRAKDEFLAIVSHELRTPLTSILGWSQLLRRGKLSLDRQERGLQIIERNALAQTRLIDDLLDVSRIISGKLILDVQKVLLPAIVEAAIDSVRPAAEAKSIVIDCRFGARDVIFGDANRLRQISYNLLSNAIKFTPKGGRVSVECGRVGAEAVIAVSDTGIGIDGSFLPYVFNRFRQADQSITREHQGLGLGLAIVRHLVELHGGTIGAESSGKNRGSRFVVRFPVLQVEVAGRELLWAGGERNLAGVSVLVVEDEPDSREILVLALQQYGASVASAGTAQDALERLDDFRPDLLLCDIGLPGEDGYAFIRKLRERSAARGGLIPAIALTAHARAEDRAEALSAGYQDHIAKPVEAAALAEVIARVAWPCAVRLD